MTCPRHLTRSHHFPNLTANPLWGRRRRNVSATSDKKAANSKPHADPFQNTMDPRHLGHLTQGSKQCWHHVLPAVWTSNSYLGELQTIGFNGSLHTKIHSGAGENNTPFQFVVVAVFVAPPHPPISMLLLFPNGRCKKECLF